MNNNEIRVKINGGYLVAGRNPDPEYDGIYIVFETDDGTLIDVAVAECPRQDDLKRISVYTYEDVYTEDWTRKYNLDVKDIYEALNM